MPYGVGVVAKKDYKVKRKAKGRFIPSHRVSALLNSWGKVYDKNGTIMESADDEETATSINRGSAAQGVKHKHVTHEKNGVKHWAVVDKESGTVRWSKNAKKATMLPPGAAREVTRVHRGSRVEKATAAVKKGVKKKAAKGPSPGKTAFDKKLAQTKRYLSSYHARRYWTHRANKMKHADAHQKAMSETRDKAGAKLRDNLWYHPAGHYEISNHMRSIETLYSGKNKPPKPKAK
jgi:hypothetical protein